MIIIQHREVGFEKGEADAPELAAGETFGDDSAVDASCWQEFSSHETPLDALCSFIAQVNASEIDDVNLYYRLVNTETEEIRGI